MSEARSGFTVSSYVIAISRNPINGDETLLLDRRPISGDYAVRLPSGMCHSFDTETEARASQYWPHAESYRDLRPTPIEREEL